MATVPAPGPKFSGSDHFFPGNIGPSGPFLPVIFVRRTKITADQKSTAVMQTSKWLTRENHFTLQTANVSIGRFFSISSEYNSYEHALTAQA